MLCCLSACRGSVLQDPRRRALARRGTRCLHLLGVGFSMCCSVFVCAEVPSFQFLVAGLSFGLVPGVVTCWVLDFGCVVLSSCEQRFRPSSSSSPGSGSFWYPVSAPVGCWIFDVLCFLCVCRGSVLRTARRRLASTPGWALCNRDYYPYHSEVFVKLFLSGMGLGTSCKAAVASRRAQDLCVLTIYMFRVSFTSYKSELRAFLLQRGQS